MNRKFLIGISVFTILSALTWRYLIHRPHVAGIKGEIYDQLAQLAGDETSKLLDNRGSVVIVQWDATALGIPRYDDPIAQYRKRLETHGINTAAVEIIKLKRGTNVPALQFAEIVRRHLSADAIVLIGPAYGLKVRDIAALPAPLPKLVSVLAFDVKLKPLFDQNLLALAIVGASFIDKEEAGAGPFMVVHPSDAHTLPVSTNLTDE